MSWKLLKLRNGYMCLLYFCMRLEFLEFSVISSLNRSHRSELAWKLGHDRDFKRGWISVRPIKKGCGPGKRAKPTWELGLSMETCILGACLILSSRAHTFPPMHPLTNPPLLPGTTFPSHVSNHLLSPLTNPSFTTDFVFSSSSMLEHEDEVVDRPIAVQ